MESFYKNKKVLVTGGAGFIGSHIAHKLVQLGAQVTVLDNLKTGFDSNLDLIKNKVKFINNNITDPIACYEATKNKNIIFHLAAFISVPASVQNPQNCYDVNVNGTFNMLEAARNNGVERFVFSSSAAVYGAQSGTCSENMECHPTSPYGTSKLIGELLCQQFACNYGLKTICLRYFNVFGDRQNPNGDYAAVVAKFKHQMKSNKPITIFGDGLQTRDFIPVSDVAIANLTLAMQNESIMDGRPFNIGTGKSINLLELIELLKKEFPKYDINAIFESARNGDIKHSGANIDKWKSIFKSINNKTVLT